MEGRASVYVSSFQTWSHSLVSKKLCHRCLRVALCNLCSLITCLFPFVPCTRPLYVIWTCDVEPSPLWTQLDLYQFAVAYLTNASPVSLAPPTSVCISLTTEWSAGFPSVTVRGNMAEISHDVWTDFSAFSRGMWTHCGRVSGVKVRYLRGCSTRQNYVWWRMCLIT